jgi:hypothetical protein
MYDTTATEHVLTPAIQLGMSVRRNDLIATVRKEEEV